jgi:hypothetical protein
MWTVVPNANVGVRLEIKEKYGVIIRMVLEPMNPNKASWDGLR